MKQDKLYKLVLTALLAALTYAATTIIKIPSVNGGYIHPGDGIVFLSGLILGPLYGGFAAGLGSMLVDLLSGYNQYVIGTFLIKALAAAACGGLFKLLHTKVKNVTVKTIPSGLIGAVIIVLGYFLYESIILSYGLGAAAGIPGNIFQTGFGVVTVTIIYPLLQSSKALNLIKR
ncbi:MAG TPA: ECF transporter S component [Lachnospiraceae bacterium]|nr:ECF transporter S component [Lachnospiraceae bacterium]